MNKEDLIISISKRMKISNNLSRKGVQGIINAITLELASGGRTEVRGFGSFYTKPVSARFLRNPKNGEPVFKDAHLRVMFKPYESFRVAVDK